MMDCKEVLNSIKGASYSTDFSIDEFESLSEFESFVRYLNKNGIVTLLDYEMCNCHGGVVLRVCDKSIPSKRVTVDDLINTLSMFSPDTIVMNSNEQNIRICPGKNSENNEDVIMIC